MTWQALISDHWGTWSMEPKPHEHPESLQSIPQLLKVDEAPHDIWYHLMVKGCLHQTLCPLPRPREQTKTTCWKGGGGTLNTPAWYTLQRLLRPLNIPHLGNCTPCCLKPVTWQSLQTLYQCGYLACGPGFLLYKASAFKFSNNFTPG